MVFQTTNVSRYRRTTNFAILAFSQTIWSRVAQQTFSAHHCVSRAAVEDFASVCLLFVFAHVASLGASGDSVYICLQDSKYTRRHNTKYFEYMVAVVLIIIQNPQCLKIPRFFVFVLICQSWGVQQLTFTKTRPVF